MYNKFMCTCSIFTIRVRARDLLEILVDFLFRSLVMLVCIILCNKLFTVNHNIKGIYIYLQERKRREIVLIIEVNIYKREREEKLFLL